MGQRNGRCGRIQTLNDGLQDLKIGRSERELKVLSNNRIGSVDVITRRKLLGVVFRDTRRGRKRKTFILDKMRSEVAVDETHRDSVDQSLIVQVHGFGRG